MTADKFPSCKGVVRLSLNGNLDLASAEGLKDEFLSGLGAGEALTIDASAVERISTAAIQTLIAGAAALKSAGVGFNLSSPSEAFVKAFQDLGLTECLNQWGIET